MNINVLKEFKIIFLKFFITIILDHTYLNYIYKITLTYVFFIFKVFSSIFINFEPEIFVKIFIDIFDIYVKYKYQCICVY